MPLPADPEASFWRPTFALYFKNFVEVVRVFVAAATGVNFNAVFVVEHESTANMRAFKDGLARSFFLRDFLLWALVADVHALSFVYADDHISVFARTFGYACHSARRVFWVAIDERCVVGIP